MGHRQPTLGNLAIDTIKWVAFGVGALTFGSWALSIIGCAG